MDFRCVECGFHIKTLYVQYSPGNIRLMKCENCKAVADEYIECEAMILLIDLILHKEKAYRHLFYNMFNQDSMNFEGLLWKLGFSFLVLDTYRIFVLSKSEEDLGGSSRSFDAFSWSFVKMMVELVFGNLICACILLIGTRFFLNASIRCRDVLLAVLVSSYFKVFLIAMMVWEFPPSVLFVVDVFVLSSNVVALKVLSGESVSTTKCLGICLSAIVSKFLVSWLLNIHPLDHST